MANYEYISLPITLASNKLFVSIKYQKKSNDCLICYSIIDDEIYFSGVYSENTIEYICNTQEEFEQKVAEYKLLRVL